MAIRKCLLILLPLAVLVIAAAINIG